VKRLFNRKRNPVRHSGVPTDVLDQLGLLGSGDGISAVAAQRLVVGHGAADTSSAWLENGKPLASSQQGSERVAVKVSLTERVSIEARGVVVGEQRFPGRQGRLVFAYLLAAHGRPVPKDELADALWGDHPPERWDKALTVLVSKLRALLNECGVDGSGALTSAFACYQLTLPAGSWIDVVAAEEAQQAARQALTRHDPQTARLNASIAESLARGTFLPGEDARWVEEKRAELHEILTRALECLAEANRLAGDTAAAVRAADELVLLEPFRDGGYRLLMQAQLAAGNDAEALRTYERCRARLAEDLGAYPSAETEALYLDILRKSPETLAVDGMPATLSPLTDERPRRGGRRKLGAAAAALLVAGAAVATLILTRGDEAPPEVLPNSVVRIDPDTLEPSQVVRIGPRADLVVAAGGYVWVTHGLLRYDDGGLRDAGDRTLTRVDPSTGKEVVVGGGLAPCGLAADPSGDVWVANCYASRPGANVVRVGAQTLAFKATWPVPSGAGYFKGIAYGGGSLWVADTSGASDLRGVTQVDPQTGARRTIKLDRHAGWLAWSEGYGDLWMNDFARGSVSRIHAETGDVKTYESVATEPATLVVDGDAVWVGAWGAPEVVRVPAVGPGQPRRVSLPTRARPAGVTSVASGAGSVWVTVPDDHAVSRIDPKTYEATRIPLRYFPWGVTADEDGVWVTMRANDVP